MAGWYLSEQARHVLHTARALARDAGDPTPGSTDLLLAAILGQWDDEHAGGPALLRACGLTTEQARTLSTKLLAAYRRRDPTAPAPAEPRLIGSLRFVVDQAERIAAQTHAPYVGTEHLIVAMLWQDTADKLRRLGVSYALAVERLATLPHRERVEAIDPLETAEVPTPAVATLDELARQQTAQHPIQGDGRISTLHYLLALLMGRTAASRLLGELGVTYPAVVERLAETGDRLIDADDWRPDELPLEGWEQFDVTPEERVVIGRQVGRVLAGSLWEQGVRFAGSDSWVRIHPGRSGLQPRELLGRFLGGAS